MMMRIEYNEFDFVVRVKAEVEKVLEKKNKVGYF